MFVKNLNRFFLSIAALTIAIVGFGVSNNVVAGPKAKMSTPTIVAGDVTPASIDIVFTAGATGAPAGFSLQWITAEALAAGPDGILGTADDNTWPASDSLSLCKASFSGNANGSSYNLLPYQSVTVTIGDVLFDDPGASSNCASIPLDCDTLYAFRAFAHANSTLNRSDFTANLLVLTDPCDDDDTDGCTLTQGYWKTHGPTPSGNNVNVWPVDSLFLGSVSYSEGGVDGYPILGLQDILDKPAQGNGLVSLAHQLIAAKLNVANGADPTAAADAIAAADALIGGLIVPPVGDGSLPNNETSEWIGILASYNEGKIGPGHCNKAEPVIV